MPIRLPSPTPNLHPSPEDRQTSFAIHISRATSSSDTKKYTLTCMFRIVIIPILFMTVSDAGIAGFNDRGWYTGGIIAFGLTLPALIWSVFAVLVYHRRFDNSKFRSFVHALTPLAAGLCIGGAIAIIVRGRGWGALGAAYVLAAMFDFTAGFILLALSIATMTRLRVRIIFPKTIAPYNAQAQSFAYTEDSDDSRDVERGLASDRAYGSAPAGHDDDTIRGRPAMRQSLDVRGSMDSEQAEGAALLGFDQSLRDIVEQKREKSALEERAVYN